jgi:hypothetical protein
MVGVVNSQLLAGQDQHRFLKYSQIYKQNRKKKAETDAIKTVKGTHDK